jgi:hypothetical protein
VKAKVFHGRAVLALCGMLMMCALVGAPGAAADDPCLPENGCVPPVVAPPLPPDQFGDPGTESLGASQIPGLPPYVEVPLPITAPTHKTCKQKRKHAAAAKKCKSRKKRR